MLGPPEKGKGRVCFQYFNTAARSVFTWRSFYCKAVKQILNAVTEGVSSWIDPQAWTDRKMTCIVRERTISVRFCESFFPTVNDDVNKLSFLCAKA